MEILKLDYRNMLERAQLQEILSIHTAVKVLEVQRNG